MLKNGLYNVVGAAIRLLLAIATIPLLINLIGIEQYGLWALVSSAIAIVALAEGGLGVSTVVFVSRDLASANNIALSQTLTIIITIMFLLASSAALIMWFGAKQIIGFFPRLEPDQVSPAVRSIQLGGIVIWARLFQNIAAGIMQAYNEYGKLNVLRTLNAIANTVGLLAIVYLGGRIVEMMQWTVIASVVLLVLFSIGAILLLKGARITPQWNGAKGKDILSYSLTSWGAALGGTMFTRFDRLIIGSILGTSILGVYAAITDIAVQINSFSALAVQPVLPTLSFELVKKEVKTEHIEDKIKQALQINMLVALILGAGLIIFAPVIVEVLLSGSTVVNQIFVFRAAIIIYSLYSLNAAGYFVLYSVNAVSEVLWTQLIVGVVTLVCIALGATYFGLRGAIFSNVVYIGTGWLTIRSMNHYNIPASKWLKWIVFPLACFFSLVLLVFVSPEHLSLHMIALFSTTMILGIWFFNLQRESIGISLSKLEKTP